MSADEHPVNQARIDQVRAEIEKALEILGNPPHLISIITGDQEQGGPERVASVIASVSAEIKMPHFRLMIGQLFIALAGKEPSQIDNLIRMAHDSAHEQLLVLKQLEEIRRSNRPNPNLN